MPPAKTTLALAALFLAASTAFAGTSSYSYKDDKKAVQPLECPPDALTLFSTTDDFGFRSTVQHTRGALESNHLDVNLNQRIPLNFLSWPNQECRRWYLRLGADYERFDFALQNEESRLPGMLQSVAGTVALEYLVKGQTAILIESEPGVYFERKASSRSFDAPTDIAAVIPIVHDTFYLVAGVRLSLLDEYHALPLGGILWHISDKWDLRAYLPNPRLVYQASDRLEFYAGAEIDGNAYTTDGLTARRLNGAVVTYDDIRAGAGVTWKMKPLAIDLAAGYSLQKEFDYHRAGQDYRTNPVPYIRVSARLDF